LNLAPIAFFVYNRPRHTELTLEALRNNYLSDQSELFIFSDGPKINYTEEELSKILEVRKIIASKNWCKTVHVIEYDHNKGLASAIVDGIDRVFLTSDKIIVLEDDLITSKGFLQYMNEALNIYSDDTNVMHISGYQHPFIRLMPETFFTNTMNCSGWGTWKRAWQLLITDPDYLARGISKLYVSFIDPLNYRICEQLKANINGTNSTWAVKWYCTIILNNGLCLNPKTSLVKNIGFDNSGSNPLNDLKLLSQETSDHIILKRKKNKLNRPAIVLIYLMKFFSSSFQIKKEMISKILFPRCEYYL
jgi:hypothetical protein